MTVTPQDQLIKCPKCSHEFKVSETLAATITAELKGVYDKKLDDLRTDIATREKALKDGQEQLEKDRESVDEAVAEILKAEREKISAAAKKKAKLEFDTELSQKTQEIKDLEEIVEGKNSKLKEAQDAQADYLEKSRQLEDDRKAFNLTVQQKVNELLEGIRTKAKSDAGDEYKLQVSERDEMIRQMQEKIEELKKKAEQGSQQLQGEVSELDLEESLRTRFPHDSIEPIAKGENGADVAQHVGGKLGKPCGSILWESKRTKGWGKDWISKLKDDQRKANAEIAVIVSTALPKGMACFDIVEGVWVTPPNTALPLACALRHALIEIGSARRALDGQQSKQEEIYRYGTGTAFRLRVQAIGEKVTAMEKDLAREQKSIKRFWAARTKQIEGIVEAQAGLLGDIQGIAGDEAPEIETFNFEVKEASTAVA